MPYTIDCPYILVVEGMDDKGVFDAIIGHMGIDDLQILPIGGKTRFRYELSALVKAPNWSTVTSIGIIRDADDDPHAAFDSICGALRSVDLPVPKNLLVPEGKNPTVTVMVLPDGISPGMLEDLCLKASEDDPAIQCVDGYFGCLAANAGNGCPYPKPNDLSKAKVQVLMASRIDCVRELGVAAQKGCWDWEHDAFNGVKRFINLVRSIDIEQANT